MCVYVPFNCRMFSLRVSYSLTQTAIICGRFLQSYISHSMKIIRKITTKLYSQEVLISQTQKCITNLSKNDTMYGWLLGVQYIQRTIRTHTNKYIRLQN